MKRTPLKRKTPLRGNPEKIKEWKNRSRVRIAPVSKKRRRQEVVYSADRRDFIRDHPICPLTGDATTEIHHSAHREGEWLNIKRFWIALSSRGHKWVTDNSRAATAAGLMYPVNPGMTAKTMLAYLEYEGIDPDVPVFYINLDLRKSVLESIRNEINR